MDTPNYPNQTPWNPSQPPAPPPPWWQDRFKLTIVTVVGVSAVVVIALLAFNLGVRGGEGAVASATPTPSSSVASTEPSPSASEAEPTDSAEPSSSVDPSPSASATAEPTRAPQAELSQGWAVLTTGLNLRNQAGTDFAIVTKLPAREVVWVESGPYHEESDDEFDWYYVNTLNDKYGWIASGAPDDPNAVTVSNEFKFRSCGKVGVAGNSGLVNNFRTGKLSEVSRATFALGQTMGSRGCIVFSNEGYDPTSRVEVTVHACGAPSWDGSTARLAPTTAGNVDAARRVASTVDVPNVLLTDNQRPEADGLTRQQKFFVLGSRLSSPFMCFTSEFVKGKARSQDNTTELADCLVITAKDDQSVTFDPPNGDPVTFRRGSRDNLNSVLVNDAKQMRLRSEDGSFKTEVLGDC
jgi:hypothetical protein